jgi:hypothetical protein
VNRREVLGALGVTAAGLAGLAVSEARAADDDKGHEHRHYQKCAKACAAAQVECDANFHHCAEMVSGGKKDHAKSMRLSIDCAELCAATARLCGRESPLGLAAAETCAKACEACAAECEKEASDEQMKACAKACRDCAAECHTIVKHLGHDHHAPEK